jgi:WD40 repeat protein
MAERIRSRFLVHWIRYCLQYLCLLLFIVAARAEEANLYLQLGHSYPVVSVAFSPDGHLVLTGSGDSTARLWDLTTGRELRTFVGHAQAVTCLAFSPDGRSILTGSWDRTARLWDISSGREMHRFEGQLYPFSSVAFSPDGRLLLTSDGMARIWDAATGKELHRFGDRSIQIYSAAFSPDGLLILTVSTDGTARLWDVATGREVRDFEGPSKDAFSVAFSPDGRTVLTGHKDNTARLWEVATGREIRRFEGHSGFVNPVAFSPDGRSILTGSDQIIRLWDLATGREIRRFEDYFAQFSPDGRSILTSGKGNTAQLWDISTGNRIRRFESQSNSVTSLAISSDGRTVLTGSADKMARLWDLTTGREIRRFAGHSDQINSVAISPDGRFVLTGGEDETARIWDRATGIQARSIQGEVFNAVAFSPDGRSFLTGSGTLMRSGKHSSDKARLWDVDSARQLRPFDIVEGSAVQLGSGVTSAAFSADGRYVVTGTFRFTAELWETATGRQIRTFEGHEESVNSVAFSPNDRTILTGSQDGTARLWDVTTGREIIRFENKSPIRSVAFSPDGRSVLTGDMGKTVRLWDVATGREIRRFEGHSEFITCVAFSPDGRLIFTASHDGTTRRWEAPTGRWLASLVSFANGGWAAVDPDGRYDSNDPDHIDSLYWRVGSFGTVSLSQLRRSFYTPGLLANIVRGAPVPPVKGLNQIAYLPANISATISGEPSHPVLQVKLNDLNNAAPGPVTIRVNGRPFAAQRLSETKSAGGETLNYNLADAHLGKGANKITVTAASFDNLIESDPALATWNQESAVRGSQLERTAQPQKSSACIGHFYGIFVGVGTFPFAPDLNLRYPANDAQTLSNAIRLGAESLCGKDRVELITLTSANSNAGQQPTKENIHRAFETIAAKSTRNDMLFVYFSGHGAAPANDPHAYFFLAQDARQVNVEIADKLRESTTVSGAELVKWLTNPNLPDKQVLVLDTCAAGAANTQLARLTDRSRSVSDDLKKAVDNWNLDTGTYILMGSATDRSSYESDRFRHGLLTYALLHGMKGDALLDGERLEAAHWFETAIPAVQKYAAMIGRDQRPQEAVPTAVGGVPIGFFTESVRAQIALPDLAPTILKLTLCFEESAGSGPLRDPLKLTPLIRSELRALTNSESRDSAVTYDDNNTESFPGALTPQIRYRAEGTQLKLTITLLQDETTSLQTTLNVPTTDVSAHTKQIAEAVLKLASGAHGRASAGQTE